MIDVYTAPTPNGVKVPIALEELELPYRIVRVDLGTGEQKRPEFLEISPNGRIPAIVDPDGPSGRPIAVFESGAILFYLAEKANGLLPLDPEERIRALEYSFFQVGGVGPMFGQAGWFQRSAPEQIPFALERYQGESKRLTEVLESRLGRSLWLAGGSYSIADILCFGWLRVATYAGVDLARFPAVKGWVERIEARPAVKRGLAAIG
jgi:GST-like protein